MTRNRMIDSVQELDALPDNAVVLDLMDGPLIKIGGWFRSPTIDLLPHSVLLPTEVLYEGIRK